VSAEPLPIVCAWCERVRSLAGCWEVREVEPELGPATHGICPECLLAEQREAVPPAGCCG
jgi:hypothetical protein